MKPGDLRAMTVDQLDDEALKLKKERFNLRFQRATGQLENTARVRQVRRDIARIKTIAAQKRAASSKSKSEEARDAEAHAAGRRRERQAGQDRGGARRAPLYPSGHEEDGTKYQEVLRPRRDQRVPRRRHRLDRGAPAALQAQAVGSHPGRKEESSVSAMRVEFKGTRVAS